MVNLALDLFVKSQSSRISVKKLLQTADIVKRDIFREKDPNFWFNKGYLDFKTRRKPKQVISTVEKFLSGEKILDFGCGSGLLLPQLVDKKYQIFLTDILDYRDKTVSRTLFRKMPQRTKIPFGDDSMDSVIAQNVLHHVFNKDLKNLLGELRRVAKRLVLGEEVYNIKTSLPSYQKLWQEQLFFRAFGKLSKKDQFFVMVLNDYFSNCIILSHLGVPEINLPFTFRTVEEWEKELQKTGWRLQEIVPIGFNSEGVHRVFQVWLVADRS